jgi:hypothetical protein
MSRYRAHSETCDQILLSVRRLLSESCCLVSVGRPLWQEFWSFTVCSNLTVISFKPHCPTILLISVWLICWLSRLVCSCSIVARLALQSWRWKRFVPPKHRGHYNQRSASLPDWEGLTITYIRALAYVSRPECFHRQVGYGVGTHQKWGNLKVTAAYPLSLYQQGH